MIPSERQGKMCEADTWDVSQLRAHFLHRTLKRLPELAHTEGLIRVSRAILEKNGIACDLLRPVDSDSSAYR